MSVNDALDATDKSTKLLMPLLRYMAGPRLEFIKDSRYGTQINKEINSTRFNARLASYQERLAFRVSNFTSLAFPNYSLSISTDYEPVTLVKSELFGLQKPSSPEQKTMLSPENGSAFLIDRAGMGKSTFLKYYCSSLLFKSRFVPIFIELRTLYGESNLLHCARDELDLADKKMSTDLVEALFKAGKITMLLDGYDEIAREKRSAITKNISEFSKKYPMTSFVITSRPHTTLPELIKATSFAFNHFTRRQAERLLLRYDKLIVAKYGKNLICELDNVPNDFIENPLSVALLYRSYAINGTIARKISNFYIDLYNALFQGHDLHSKDHYVREKHSGLDISDFRKVVRALSHYLIVEAHEELRSSDNFVEMLSDVKKIIGELNFDEISFIDDITKAVPLVILDGYRYRFLHKTIAEYFSAEYILNCANRDSLIAKIYENSDDEKFNVVVNFLFDLEPQVIEEVVLEKILPDVEFSPLGKGLRTDALETLKYFYNGLSFGFFELSPSNSSNYLQEKFGGVEACAPSTSISTKVVSEGVEYYFILGVYSESTDVRPNAFTRLLANVTEINDISENEVDLQLLLTFPIGEHCFLTNSVCLSLMPFPFFTESILMLLRKLQGFEYPRVLNRDRVEGYRSEIIRRNKQMQNDYF